MSISRRSVLLGGAAGLAGLTAPSLASASGTNSVRVDLGFSWNAKTSDAHLRNVYRMVSEKNPLFVCIQEANKGLGPISDVLGPRYNRVGRAADDDWAFTRLYAHKDARVHDQGALRTRDPWKGPKGRVHRGREFPWAVLKVNGDYLRVVGIHLPWIPSRATDSRRKGNLAAYKACLEALATTSRHYPGVPLLMVGDWNAYLDGTKEQVRKFTADIGGRKVATGANHDFGIYRPGEKSHPLARNLKVTGRAGNKYGSDHRVTWFSFPEV